MKNVRFFFTVFFRILHASIFNVSFWIMEIKCSILSLISIYKPTHASAVVIPLSCFVRNLIRCSTGRTITLHSNSQSAVSIYTNKYAAANQQSAFIPTNMLQPISSQHLYQQTCFSHQYSATMLQSISIRHTYLCIYIC